jgi:hypothetical protein
MLSMWVSFEKASRDSFPTIQSIRCSLTKSVSVASFIPFGNKAFMTRPTTFQLSPYILLRSRKVAAASSMILSARSFIGRTPRQSTCS